MNIYALWAYLRPIWDNSEMLEVTVDFSKIDMMIKRDFLVEARELLDECESCFVRLEKEPESQASILDRIYRCAHTLKGSSLTAGFSTFGQFVHVFENLLSQLRDDGQPVNEHITDVLLSANDKLTELVEALSHDFQAELDTEEISQQIKAILKDEQHPRPKPAEVAGFVIFDEAPKETKAPTPQRASAPLNNRLSGTVMICDDESIVLRSLSEQVKALGCQVIAMDSPDKALEYIQQNGTDFDVLISDLRMPGMDGTHFVKEVFKQTKEIPVIFCSAYASRDDMIDFLHLGVFGFIEKPVHSATLAVLLTNALRSRRINQNLSELLTMVYKAFRHANDVVFEAADKSPQTSCKALKSEFDRICKLIGQTIAVNDQMTI